MQIALVVGLLSVTVPSDPKMVTKVSVVDDRQELRRGLRDNRVKFDAVFVATDADGEAARRALRPYLDTAIARERVPARKASLTGIRDRFVAYDWHCGGFVRHGRRAVFCIFDHGIIRRSGPGRFFPAIADGGIGVCRCVFSLRKRRIVSLDWNDEA